MTSAALLAKCCHDPESPERQGENAKEDRGGRREGKTTDKGKLWKLVTSEMYLRER